MLLEKESPTVSFLRSLFFLGRSMSVILRRRNLVGLPFSDVLDLLHYLGGKDSRIFLDWLALGKFVSLL